MKKIYLLILIAMLISGYFFLQKTKSSKPGVSENNTVTETQAVESVKKLPQVQEYLKEVSKGIVDVDNELDGEFNVHVYEIKDGHTATFNWYRVNIKTGQIKSEF